MKVQMTTTVDSSTVTITVEDATVTVDNKDRVAKLIQLVDAVVNQQQFVEKKEER